MSNIEVAIYLLCLPLLPLALYGLIKKPLLPADTLVGKMYRAEPWLGFVSNLFLLAVCVTALVRLAEHFGFLSTAALEPISPVIGAAFLLLCLASLFLHVRAYRRARAA